MIITTCKDCGHIGNPVAKIDKESIFVGVVLAVIGVVVHPTLAPIFFIAGIYMARVKSCTACKSKNLIRDKVDTDGKNTPVDLRHPRETPGQTAPQEKAALTNWFDEKTAEIQEKRTQDQQQDALRKNFVDALKIQSNHDPFEVVVLGGAGWSDHKEAKRLMSFNDANLYISDPIAMVTKSISINDIIEIDISGPGKVTSNIGMVGGGFGAEGAAQGIAIATIANLLTTHSKTKTIISLATKDAELVMMTSKIEPEPARLLFSPIFVQVRKIKTNVSTTTISEEIRQLHDLKLQGAISEEEFSKLKRNLIGQVTA